MGILGEPLAIAPSSVLLSAISTFGLLWLGLFVYSRYQNKAVKYHEADYVLSLIWVFAFPKERFQCIRTQLISFFSRKRTILSLEGVNLEVMEGEVVGIIGRNGAGKNTLLRVIAGIYAPDRGSVKLEGKPRFWQCRRWVQSRAYRA